MEALYALIRRFEGLRLKPYRCPAGVPTIGYGHTGADVKMTSPAISPEKAEALMQADAQKFILAAKALSPNLSGNALAAIADFCFNLGTGRYKASTLRRCIRDEEWEDAKEQLTKWVWGGGRKLPGLVLRRAAEALLLPD